MARVLVLLTHPIPEKSKIQKSLVDATGKLHNVDVHDLYQVNPHGTMDVAYEQELRKKHDTVVLQYTYYWHSTSPLIQQWIDPILKHDRANRKDGNQLKVKWRFIPTCKTNRSVIHTSSNYKLLLDSLILEQNELPIPSTANYLPNLATGNAIQA
jgi:putative NADPH-quinone reductase